MTQPTLHRPASDPNIDATTDIAVVGGGLSGALSALAMADRGLSVTLIDRADPADMLRAGFDGRTTAIAFACARMLRRLGAWDALAAEAQPISEILVTDGAGRDPFRAGGAAPMFLRFDGGELDGEKQDAEGAPLGWIIENRFILGALYGAMEKRAEITIRPRTGCAGVENGAGGARVRLSDGGAINASLVIAADGRPSPLRTAANIKTVRWGYPQTAIVATVAHERPHGGVAQEFFLPAGPFAILPMTENRSSLVWTERAGAAEAFLQLEEDAFNQALADRFGPYLGEVRLAGPRFSHPLSFQLATRFYAGRLALVGDAAHGIHPIAGQGYNLGMKDIAVLADIVGEAASCGLDIGSGAALEDYQRKRRFDCASLALGTDALNRLYSNDFAPVRIARRLGMDAVNRAGPLRRFFMREAGGDVGALPSLLRP